jgi:hypothetical protein
MIVAEAVENTWVVRFVIRVEEICKSHRGSVPVMSNHRNAGQF